MNNESVLQIRNLKKYFGPVKAVQGVSLDVAAGLVYGFLGPNGAGKTTTIGMVLGLLHPTEGEARVFGQPVTPGNTRPLRRVGALVGAPALVPYLSARKNLELLARLNPDLPRDRIQTVLDRVGLAGAADRAAGKFSTGMKQRLGLAMALLNQPDLLILDEPTNGMDPAGMREVRVLLRELADEGVTVFISSHLLHEIEQVCDQVAVLNQGRVVAQGSVTSLLSGQTLVKVRVEDVKETARLLRELPGVLDVQPNGIYVTASGVSSKTVIEHLVLNGQVPSEVTNERTDLESLFLELTQAA